MTYQRRAGILLQQQQQNFFIPAPKNKGVVALTGKSLRIGVSNIFESVNCMLHRKLNFMVSKLVKLISGNSERYLSTCTKRKAGEGQLEVPSQGKFMVEAKALQPHRW